ncbi:MAG TPA: type II toxin-antitoxin system HicA family toxin [Thermoplasmata archaeon]|nr:type II toxin-antitoxin system HicA family toxin [Thermoplasmata archaeon]
MVRLPVVSGAAAIKAFSRAGWRAVRQSGSHVILVKEGMDVTLSVPVHATVKRGLLRRLLRDARMTVEEFVEQL